MHGEHGEVKSARGDVQDHLGMKFAFDRNKQEAKIDMCDCVNDMVDEFPVKFNSIRKREMRQQQQRQQLYLKKI